MNVEIFVRQMQTMSGRLTELYRAASAFPMQPSQVLPVAYKELGIASEKLQLAAGVILQQNEELAAVRSLLEAEHQHYKEFFECALDAYLVINEDGLIHEANRAASILFNIAPNYLIGKPLSAFAPEGERLNFQANLSHLVERDILEWVVRLQPRHTHPFDALIVASHVRNLNGPVVAVRLCVRDVTERKRAEAALEKSFYDPCTDRPKHYYSKGEVITLIPLAIWLVGHGLVKLSTLSDKGEEVIVGLAGSFAPFGASLTSLPIYQAVALSDVELVCIHLTEIALSPKLTQMLLSQVNLRLRQTELLVAIAGHRRVKDRLERLLTLLKQEIGESVGGGVRLSVRLTHEELAATCSTTRVTMTRELNKLQGQGRISLGGDRHIILKDAAF